MADITIVGLPTSVGSLDDVDIIHLSQSGIDKKGTISQVVNKVNSSLGLTTSILANASDITDIKAGNVDFTAMPLHGGAPILESGSNTDGNWVKFADGTMICRNYESILMDCNTGPDGFYHGDTLIQFPHNFISNPQVVLSGGALGRLVVVGGVYDVTTSNFYSRPLTIPSGVVAVQVEHHWVAMGSWK